MLNASVENTARYRRDSYSEILINTIFALFYEKVNGSAEFSPSSKFFDNIFSDNVQLVIVNVSFTFTVTFVMYAFVLFRLSWSTVIGFGQANPTR